MHTSAVDFSSSIHGAQRRSQRDISKRDLQAAVKYGVKERGFSNKSGEKRWKYTFADVVYITDETSTKEVTSWALELPLDRKTVTRREQIQHDEAKRRLAEFPGNITSHYVFVVDMSSSMRGSDMNGHKSRFRAVYFSLAEEFTTKLCSGAFSGTDVATLIEMRDDANVVFEAEPIDSVLFNQFVELAERDKTNKEKKLAAHSHGNFFPSIQKAFELLVKYDHVNCAPSLFILSDGLPSDPWTNSKYANIRASIPEKKKMFLVEFSTFVRRNCECFRDRLTFAACGYGSADFSVLEGITSAALFAGIKEAKFLQTCIDPDALGLAMTSILSSTTELRTRLSRISAALGDSHELTKSVKEKYSNALSSQSFSLAEWRLFANPNGEGVFNEGSFEKMHRGTQRCERYAIDYVQDLRKERVFHAHYKKIGFLNPASVGILVKNNHFGEGAERIVYEMTEIDVTGKPVGIPLVAKDSKMKLDPSKQHDFHLGFLKTQSKAANLALKFNAKMNSLKIDKGIPRISFLNCFVYGCDALKQEFLSEARLNPDKYVKWNDNAGHVDGVRRLNPMFASMKEDLSAIEEEEEEQDDEDVSDEEGSDSEDGHPAHPRIIELQDHVLDSDVPQAFSHWTHVYSKRDLLVCDLQGELVENPDKTKRYQLTDPCIHRRDRETRRDPCIHRRDRETRRDPHKNDRTDKGSKGINEFFQTHNCNALCDILKLINIRQY